MIIRYLVGSLWALAFLLTPVHAQQQGKAGDFDYYILALSWSPTFCADEEEPERRRQCRLDRHFIVHGLWPQYERGWPQNCPTSFDLRLPSMLLDRFADITPDRGLLAYQWRKHGVCSGLSPREYFETARDLREKVKVPPKLLQARQPFSVSRKDLRSLIFEKNEGLPPDGIAITCDNRRLDEVRICFNRDGDPRTCGSDVLSRTCGNSPMIVLPPGTG